MGGYSGNKHLDSGGCKGSGEEEVCEQDEEYCQCREGGPETGGQLLVSY